MGSKLKNDNPHTGDGASPGKIFIGGLAKDTTLPQFNKYFAKYGEIIDSVIMKDKYTGHPRGFGFITYADPSVVDKIIEEDHIINGKQVEIKRTIPKGSSQSNDFKTKKIFVGGIPSSITEDEFSSFFFKYGNVIEHQIIRDHATNRSRGFGFIIFDSEEIVDDMLSRGNMIDMAGTQVNIVKLDTPSKDTAHKQVEIKKAQPKKASNPPPASAYGSNSRGRSYDDGFGGYGGSYGGFDGGFGPGPYRTLGSLGGRLGDGYGYGSGGGEFGTGYGGFGGSSLGGYRGESSLGYSDRFGHYVGGFGGGYGGSGVGGYGRGGDAYVGYAGSAYGSGYDSGSGASYGGAGRLYGRGGYNSSSRYHPYAR